MADYHVLNPLSADWGEVFDGNSCNSPFPPFLSPGVLVAWFRFTLSLGGDCDLSPYLARKVGFAVYVHISIAGGHRVNQG